MLTCRRREKVFGETLARWRRTDWPGAPVFHFDHSIEGQRSTWGTAAHAERVTDAYRHMLEDITASRDPDDEWLLLMEDDLEFHPHLAAHVRAWGPLKIRDCVLGSLFNPQLPEVAAKRGFENAFITGSKTFLGAQALLIRRMHAVAALSMWRLHEGLPDQRLARLLAPLGMIFVHSPSLVQHVGAASSWGANPLKALDFEPLPEKKRSGAEAERRHRAD